jgi:Pectinacetylesterase
MRTTVDAIEKNNMKKTFKFLKWLFIGVLTILIAGFLYLYFIVFAKPEVISSLDQATDDQWRSVPLGAETKCGDGSEYQIFVRRGKSENLIIHFSGGGACWDDTTCSAPINVLGTILGGMPRDLKTFYLADISIVLPALLSGILNAQDHSNPFKDWNVVFIPYTTGDLHIGNVISTYQSKQGNIQVHHNGRKNVLAALDWISRNFTTPDKVLVSGESAGAYASAFWTPSVAAIYKNQKIYQLSDGSLLVSKRWPEIIDTVWKAESQSFLKFKIGHDVFEDALLNRPDSLNRGIKHLHCNTLYDLVLPKFSAALNHKSSKTDAYIDEWSKDMLVSMKKLADSNLDYYYFISDCQFDAEKHATPHTLTTNPGFNSCESDQLTFAQWLKKVVIEDEPVSVGSKFIDALR